MSLRVAWGSDGSGARHRRAGTAEKDLEAKFSKVLAENADRCSGLVAGDDFLSGIMKRFFTSILLVVLLALCSCASRSRGRQMIEKFFAEPSVPATYTTNLLRFEYVMGHIEGFNSFMMDKGNQPEPYIHWFTEETFAAERDGYLAGVAAAYDAWLHYSRTNVPKVQKILR